MRSRPLSLRLATPLWLVLPALVGGRCCDPDPIPNFQFEVQDATLFVQGRPWVPRVIYMWPDHARSQGRNPLEDVAATGADTLVAYYEYVRPDAPPQPQPRLAEVAREAERLGLRFFIGQPRAETLAGLSEDEIRARLDRSYQVVKSSPAFMGWMIDEPGNNGMDLALTKRLIAAQRAVSPGRLVWVSFAPDYLDHHGTPADLQSLAALADVIGGDLYPIPSSIGCCPSYPQVDPSSPGRMAADLRSRAPDKPVWMFLQGNRWQEYAAHPPADDRFPTLQEQRFMAYDQLLVGARGVGWFGINVQGSPDGPPLDAPSWAVQIPTVDAELDALDDHFVLGHPVASLMVTGDGPLRHAAREHDNTIMLVVDNPTSTPRQVHVSWDDVPGFRMTPIDGGPTEHVDGSTIELPLAGFTARAWRMTPDP